MNPWPIVKASLRRDRFAAILFVALIALAVALGIAISAQERALRQGSARAADRFDLIVAAPGSPNDVLFSVVYLDPSAVELLPRAASVKALAETRVEFAAPVGFGDNHRGDPVVGTIASFVEHLSGGLAEGRAFARIDEAVVGALSPARIGDELEIGHGHASAGGGGEDADSVGEDAHRHEHEGEHDHGDHAHSEGEHAHPGDGHAHAGDGHEGEHNHSDHAHSEGDHAHPEGEHAHAEGGHSHAEGAHHHHHFPVTVVGRMKPTGTPWDRAVVVPIEYNWRVHGLQGGHAPGEERIGPPFDAETLPGIPAIVMKPRDVAAAYGLRSLFRTTESTAFFPAEVLVEIYAVMGNVASVMGALTLASQVLVVAAILAGILALLGLRRRQFAVIRALGAPPAFLFSAVWLYVAVLIGGGTLIGLPLGWAAASAVSALVSKATGVAMTATIGASELALIGALLVCGMVLALIPAWLVYRRPVVEGLRS